MKPHSSVVYIKYKLTKLTCLYHLPCSSVVILGAFKHLIQYLAVSTKTSTVKLNKLWCYVVYPHNCYTHVCFSALQLFNLQ